MKKLVALLITIAAFGQLKAQDDAISKFFGKYEEDISFSNVSINSRMFSLFTDLEVEDEEDQEVLDAISKLKGLKILAKEDGDGKKLYKEAFSLLPRNQYDELMSIRDEDKDMKFLIKEKGGTISELLMIMGGDDEFFILSLVGDIDLNQIARLSSKMDIDGLENLKKLEKGN